MAIRYTAPMLAVMTAPLETRIQRCIEQFPELVERTVAVGLTMSAEGTAEADKMTIRLHVRRRKQVSCFTIGHELTHLLQSTGLRLVPDGEVQCDVWTLSRSELFLDDRPSYLCPHLWTRASWSQHAPVARQLCIEAIERRRTNRRYLMWLTDQLERLGSISTPAYAAAAEPPMLRGISV